MVLLVASDGTEFPLSAEAGQGSNFIKALLFEQEEERRIEVPKVPPAYLALGVKFLEDSTTFQDFRILTQYPLLNQYLYGYLGIDTFQDVYRSLIIQRQDFYSTRFAITDDLELLYDDPRQGYLAEEINSGYGVR